MLRPKHILVALIVMSLLVALPLGQDKEKIKRLTPTHKGSTGLFNLSLADTLRPGEFSIGLNAHKFFRDPGDLDYTIFPVSFTVGLSNRIEFFGSFEAYKRVHNNGLLVNKVLPGGTIVPSVQKNGQVGYYNESPFMDVGFGDGTGDLWTGLKFNLLSERRGDGFGLAIQPIAKIHVTDERQHLLRGLTSGSTDIGVQGIFTRNLPGNGTLVANVGVMTASDLKGVDRQPSFTYGLGFEKPVADNKASIIAELVGSRFYGSQRVSSISNDPAPVDAYVGLRVFPADWLAVSGAASIHLTSTDTVGLAESDCLGFYAQAAFQRKINEVPTVECSADSTNLIEGDKATITATAWDPDDDSLEITWKASGGKLSESNSSATLDTTGLAPGRYSVSVDVSDGENVAACSVDLNVAKRKIAPTIECTPGSVSVTEGKSVTLNAKAADANGDALTYTWAVDGSSVTNNRPDFEFGTAGRSVGAHKVRVTVTDVDSMSASCEFAVTVERRPNTPPTVSLALDKAEVFAGESVTAKATAKDAENDPITYSWKVDGKDRSENADQITINTGGMAGGSHSVVVNVADDRGGAASDTKSFKVTEKIIIPVDNRVDNKAKAMLDEIALKMQQNPQLRARLTGHTDDTGSEQANEKAGMKRAEQVQDYLVKQHSIDTSRIELKSAGETSPIADNSTKEGQKQNRRVEVELYVP